MNTSTRCSKSPTRLITYGLFCAMTWAAAAHAEQANIMLNLQLYRGDTKIAEPKLLVRSHQAASISIGDEASETITLELRAYWSTSAEQICLQQPNLSGKKLFELQSPEKSAENGDVCVDAGTSLRWRYQGQSQDKPLSLSVMAKKSP